MIKSFTALAFVALSAFFPTLIPEIPLSPSLQVEPEQQPVIIRVAFDGRQIRIEFEPVETASADRIEPEKVADLSLKAYELLALDLGYTRPPGVANRIDVKLVREDGREAAHGNALEAGMNGISPHFVIERYGRQEVPTLLVPENYASFLKRWADINGQRQTPDLDSALAGSLMHEMTHAVLFGYHKNLGSTERGDRSHDWFIEGLARYYETKIGSRMGFEDPGFRHHLGDRIQFSRGGANFYLKNTNQDFFSLRYENALFWLYFEKSFGQAALKRVSVLLRDAPETLDNRDIVRRIEKSLGIDFAVVLAGYHEWVFAERYRKYPEGKFLGPPVKETAFWSASEDSGAEVWHRSEVLPGGMDIQDTQFKDFDRPQTLRLRLTGPLSEGNLTGIIRVVTSSGWDDWRFELKGEGQEIESPLAADTYYVTTLLSNTDLTRPAPYEIILES